MHKLNKPAKFVNQAGIFFFIIFCFTLAHGGTAPVTTYSLEDLCTMASGTMEEILIAEQDQTIARQERHRALSVLMPRATAFAGTRIYQDPDYNAPDINTMGVKLNQSFTLNGKELIALKITDDSIEKAQFNIEKAKNDTVFKVAEAFYRILSAQSFYDIAMTDVERLTKHKNSVERRFKLGDSIKTALFRARAELSKAQTEVVRAKNAVTLANASLKSLVKIEHPFALAKPMEIDSYPLTLEELKNNALKMRPELKAIQQTINIAEKTVQFEKSDRWPSITLEGTYVDSRNEFDTPVHSVSKSTDYLFEASLNFTLFDGGLISAQVAQALAKKRQALLNFEALEKNILLESENAWLDFQTSTSILVSLKQELKAANENLDAVSMQFKYGTADSVDMMDANTLFVSAQRRLSDATYTHALSILEMIHTQGNLFSFLVHKP